jgi:hypothetical protein
MPTKGPGYNLLTPIVLYTSQEIEFPYFGTFFPLLK